MEHSSQKTNSYTPGPWTIVKEWSPGGELTYIDGPDKRPVALIKSIDPDKALANARLISAAPELLAALKDVQRWMSVKDPYLPKVNSAIAKAEGKD